MFMERREINFNRAPLGTNCGSLGVVTILAPNEA
jgi:hypothetical protein